MSVMKACDTKSMKSVAKRGRVMADVFERLAEHTGLSGTGEERSPPLFYRILMRVFPPMVRSLTNVRYEGLHNLPKNGAVILAGNHTSHIDPIAVIMGARKPIRYLAKSEHFDGGVTKLVMITTGQIKTNREAGGGGALAAAVDVLKGGGWMGIFPEGTRSRRKEPPFLQQGKTGVARLGAKFPHAKIVPIAIIGAREFMQPGKMKIRLFAPVTVRIGKPISFAEWVESPEGGSMDEGELLNLLEREPGEIQTKMGEMYRNFTNQLMSSIRSMGAP